MKPVIHKLVENNLSESIDSERTFVVPCTTEDQCWSDVTCECDEHEFVEDPTY